ncbi:MAG: hypothetical protein ABIR62_11975 [Dokdonella sp.]|uniref:hypothetical protein n=1 Tax=Dokdonella sp. TaxID=2291710 RepID=UPI003262E7D2
MNGQLPVEGQNVEVKLVEGEWQAAVYREAKFVDLYGLPLEADKISEWRTVDEGSAGESAMNGPSRIPRNNLASGPVPVN